MPTTCETVSIERLKAREEAAFRELVRCHHGMLVRLARTIVASAAAADDVAQDTWFAAVQSIDRFEGRSSLAAWLASIAINKARTRARRDGRFVAWAEDAGRDTEEDGPAVDPGRFVADGHWVEQPALWDVLDPERIIAGREIWRHVEIAIAALPPGQRAVVTLRDIAGCEAAEVCLALEITAENQRVLLHRARARLRATIEDLMATVVAAGHDPQRHVP